MLRKNFAKQITGFLYLSQASSLENKKNLAIFLRNLLFLFSKEDAWLKYKKLLWIAKTSYYLLCVLCDSVFYIHFYSPVTQKAESLSSSCSYPALSCLSC